MLCNAKDQQPGSIAEGILPISRAPVPETGEDNFEEQAQREPMSEHGQCRKTVSPRPNSEPSEQGEKERIKCRNKQQVIQVVAQKGGSAAGLP